MKASTIKIHLTAAVIPRRPHSVHQSASPLHPLLSPSRSGEPSGTSSSGSPGISALLHHSGQGGNEDTAQYDRLHTSMLAGMLQLRCGDIAVKNDWGKSSNGETDQKGTVKSLKAGFSVWLLTSFPADFCIFSHAFLMCFTHQTHASHPG